MMNPGTEWILGCSTGFLMLLLMAQTCPGANVGPCGWPGCHGAMAQKRLIVLLFACIVVATLATSSSISGSSAGKSWALLGKQKPLLQSLAVRP